MTKDDIIRLAEEAGWTGPKENVTYIAMLERFANLVTAAERNRIWTQDHWTEYEHKIAAIEREECAKVCDSLNEDWDHLYVEACAEEIRARGQQ